MHRLRWIHIIMSKILNFTTVQKILNFTTVRGTFEDSVGHRMVYHCKLLNSQLICSNKI